MTQDPKTMELEVPTTLSDEQIKEIAHMIDKLIGEIGEKYSPTGIEFASIALGRLMVFSRAVDCYELFHQLMGTIVQMGSEFEKTKDELTPTKE